MTRFVSQVLFFKRLFIYVLNIRLLVHFLQDDSPTKFGFLPCRVYLFSAKSFDWNSFCGTLQLINHTYLLRSQACRQLTLPCLIDSSCTNTTNIAVCGSLDFPLLSQQSFSTSHLYFTYFFLENKYKLFSKVNKMQILHLICFD